jgi:hypothetical protein
LAEASLEDGKGRAAAVIGNNVALACIEPSDHVIATVEETAKQFVHGVESTANAVDHLSDNQLLRWECTKASRFADRNMDLAVSPLIEAAWRSAPCLLETLRQPRIRHGTGV